MNVTKKHRDDIGVPGARKLPVQFVPGAFGDNIWWVRHVSSGQEIPIRWDSISLGDKVNLGDPENRELLYGCKQYLYICATDGSRRRQRGSTIWATWMYLIAFVRWLSQRNVRSLRDVSVAHVVSYRNYVQRRAAAPGGPHGSRAVDGKRLALSSQRKLVRVVADIASRQEAMGVLGTCFVPRQVAEIQDLLVLRVRTERPTPRIPDDIFVPLMQEALRWVQEEGPELLQMLAHEGSVGRRPRSNDGVAGDLKAREASAIITGGAAIREATLNGHGPRLSPKRVQSLVTVARGACFVLIAGYVGMRCSEIMSMRSGCLKSVMQPNGSAVLKISGTLYKTSRTDSGEPAEWIAGWDEPGNPVRLAVALLEALPRPSRSTGLFSAAREARSSTARNSIDRVGRSHIVKTIRAFTNRSYPQEWKFAPHQFRKTFAHYVALAGVSSTFALMRHFKHVSVLMTERYLEQDPELLSELVEASEALVEESLDRVFSSESLAGLGGERIVASNVAYRGSAGREVRRALVEMTMRDPSAQFRLTAYGLCIYDHSRAKCGGLAEKIGLDACVTCANLAVDSSHRPFWTDHLKMVEENIRAQRELGVVNDSLERQRMMAKAILDKI